MKGFCVDDTSSCMMGYTDLMLIDYRTFTGSRVHESRIAEFWRWIISKSDAHDTNPPHGTFLWVTRPVHWIMKKLSHALMQQGGRRRGGGQRRRLVLVLHQGPGFIPRGFVFWDQKPAFSQGEHSLLKAVDDLSSNELLLINRASSGN